MQIDDTSAWRRAIPVRAASWARRDRLVAAWVPASFFLLAVLSVALPAVVVSSSDIRLPMVFLVAFGLGVLLRSCWTFPSIRLGVWTDHPGLHATSRRLSSALDSGDDTRRIAELVAEGALSVTGGSVCRLTLSGDTTVQADATGVRWIDAESLTGLPSEAPPGSGTGASMRAELAALGEELGTIVVWPRINHRFGRRDEDLLALLAQEAALALKNSLLMASAHNQMLMLEAKISEAEWWRTQLGEYADSLERTHRELSQARTTLEETYMQTLQSLANAVDARDANTYGHCRRVAELASMLAVAIGLPEEERRTLERAALLHDIGKLGVPDSTLRKLTPLDRDDASVIRQHPELGYRMLSGLRFLGDGLLAIRYHHERYDGTGYPFRLAGEQIPLLARILAVADAYDAITSDRPYRHALSRTKALEELARCAGTHFDPTVVAALLHALDQAA
ncbi:MAG: HD-GYP domain-containing protein [Sphingomonadaceae bacterium]